MTQGRRNFFMRKTWLTLILVLALGVLLACGGYLAVARKPAAPTTIAVGLGDITATVNAVGSIQPRVAVDVGVQVSGQITRLLVQPGDVVTEGQLLAEIDPSILRATVEAGRAQLADLRARLDEQLARQELATLQYQRQRQMEADGATRAEDVQTALANTKVTQARVASLRAQIEQNASRLRGDEAQLGFTRIYAPIAGTVVSVQALQGQTLNATYQTPTLLRIADLSRMTVWTQVSEADIRSIRRGMVARFTTLGVGGKYWSGEIRQVLPAPLASPTGTPSAGSEPNGGRATGKAIFYTVLFDVDNPDGALLPDMTAQVSFITASVKDVLTAPLSALQEMEDKPDHYQARIVNERGGVEEREVHGGAKDRRAVQVLSGLKAGDMLVIERGTGS